MAIVFGCTCGSTLRAKEGDAGKRTRCPKCGRIVPIPGASVAGSTEATAGPGSGANPGPDPDAIAIDMTWPTQDAGGASEPTAAGENGPTAQGESTAIQIDAAVADRVEHDPLDKSRPTDGTRQYKVLTPKDYGLPGKFNPPKLEETLNMLARKGWTVKTSAVVHVHSHSGDHDELVVILER